ncbi:dihydrofolate reductase family protein [Stackebrandtia nassauensis]|uniref:Bifunctional deaminase-reductase domain protein n=1 Tax=Stackebrandtia nassauensis (strain DSM 44728 / CIP 108903 / NRRL B-16338 / NBRC 102104 / LLR-40K-21) TaxID=446470 RepID=D3PZC6_STANL|nr:dihydrofolate reductase family protein [Stackebrandtia nassauensis]ADD41600.1 bifunctional deaminase-reductase domain protein [Stackebrandtia nassauensis DSM 44728]
MRVVVSEFISLDGVVQAPGGADEDTDGGFAHGGWSMEFFDEESIMPFATETIAEADALLFGRRTWENMAAAWPQQTGDEFSDRINALPKYVVSSTLTEADMKWNTTLVPGGEAVAKVRQLREAEGRGLMLQGSPGLVRELLAEGLVDELRLMIEPVTLGGGKSIFPADGMKRPLELVSTTTGKTGIQLNVYRPKAGEVIP